MDKIIKIWLIVTITTIAAILLPTIAFGFNEEDYDIVESYKGVTFARPFPTLQVSFYDDENNVKSKRIESGGSVNDNGSYCSTWALVRVYDYYNTKTLLNAFEIFYDSSSNIWKGTGNLQCVAVKSGNVPLSGMLVGCTNVSLFYDYGEIWSNNCMTYGYEFVYDYFNNDKTDGVVNTDGLTFNPDTDEWINDDIKYDLEIVKGVEITIPDTTAILDHSIEDYVIKWQTSDTMKNLPYYRNIKLEIYEIQCGRYKDTLWSDWKDYRFEPVLASEPYAFKQYVKCCGVNNDEYLTKVFQNGFISLGFEYSKSWSVDVYTSDFLLRYKYKDENNVLHYSKNYVFVQCSSDGTYTISIPDTDDIEDITPDVPTLDNDDYTDDIYISTDDDMEVTNIFSTIKALFNTLKDFPEYFGFIFNMYPSWVVTLLSFGIGAIVIIGILKAVL